MRFYFIIGLSFIYIAYFILTYGYIPDVVYYSPKLSVNMQYLVAAISFIFGLYLLIVAYLSFKNKINLPDYSKCPKCKENHTYSDLKDGICPTCNVKTIETEEYFKRYPEELDDV